jgi:hypothetical protein
LLALRRSATFEFSEMAIRHRPARNAPAVDRTERGGRKPLPSKPTPEEIWAAFLSGPLLGKVIRTRRRFFSLFRADHRCKNCRAPFDNLGGLIMPLIGHGRYGKNPRFCRF